MKKLLLSILTLSALNFSATAQINDLTLTVNPTTVCSGESSIITASGSQIGINYFLRDASNNIIQGPIAGTGNDINFNTGGVNADETFNVLAVENPAQSSLVFDGVNDYVTLGNNNRGMSDQATVACWVKTSIANSLQFMLSNYDNTTYGFFLYINADGKAAFDGRDGNIINSAYSSSGPSTTSVNDGQWHYLVGTVEYDYDIGRLIRKIYVDGVLENSDMIGNNGHSLGSNSMDLRVGAHNNGTYSNASIDEVAIWNIALDANTIGNNYASCLTGNETGLSGYFKFDEGTGTTVTDLSSTAINGELKFMAPEVSWGDQSSSPCKVIGAELQMTQTGTVNILTNNSESLTGPATVCSGSSATISTGSSILGLEYTLMDDGGNVVSGPTAGNGSSLDFNTGVISSETTYSLLTESKVNKNTALSFDGVNDYVTLGSMHRGILNDVSVSCWVKTTASGSTQYLVTKYDYNTGFTLYIDANGKAGFGGKGLGGAYFSSGASITSVNDGQWHYITGSVKAGTGHPIIYVDGAKETYSGITNGGTLQTTGNLAVGGWGSSFSNVEIDDLSIWNRELTHGEIIANMNNCLSGSEQGLVGLYKFNDGSGIPVKDDSPLGYDGGLTNMDPSTAWVNSNASSCSTLYTSCSITMAQTHTVDVTTIDKSISLIDEDIHANQSGATYQWLDCNNNYAIISNETNASFSPLANGSFACEISLAGCVDTTDCEAIITTGLENVENVFFEVYPNPTSNQLTISDLQVEEVYVTDINGRVLKSETTNVIDVADLPNGMYSLRIHSSLGLVYSRFVKK